MLSIIIVYFEVLYQRELSFFFYFSFLFFYCRQYDIRLIDRSLLVKAINARISLPPFSIFLSFSFFLSFFFPFLRYCRKFLLNEQPVRPRYTFDSILGK